MLFPQKVPLDAAKLHSKGNERDNFFSKITLTNHIKDTNITTRAKAIRCILNCIVIGVSSNGRTAVSGTVCEGSTPSTPATTHSWPRRLAV